MRTFVLSPSPRVLRLILLGALSGLIAISLPSVQASELKRDELVVFYPTLGWSKGEVYEVEIHGSICELEPRRLSAALVRRALGLRESELTTDEKTIFRERTRLLLADFESGKSVEAVLAGQRYAFQPSAANGHFQALIVVKAPTTTNQAPAPSWRLSLDLPSGSGLAQVHKSEVFLARTNGISIVSDIDDTIKVSEVRNKKQLLRNTLCRKFQPVEGMAGVYRAWAEKGGAMFHYVSASPWQLYLPLAEFLSTNGFPSGTVHLQPYRIKDGSVLNLFKSPEPRKAAAIELLFRRCPGRRFVLVGDSGERDPEVYAALARLHPQQVVCVLIRDVTGEKPEALRYRELYSALPKGLLKVFSNPSEIAGIDLAPSP